MSDENKKDNPGIPTRMAVLETKVSKIEEYIDILMDPKEGVLMQIKEVKHTLKFWPGLIGVVVTLLTIIVLVKSLFNL